MDFAIEKVKMTDHFEFRLYDFKNSSQIWFRYWSEVVEYLTKRVGEQEIK